MNVLYWSQSYWNTNAKVGQIYKLVLFHKSPWLAAGSTTYTSNLILEDISTNSLN